MEGTIAPLNSFVIREIFFGQCHHFSQSLEPVEGREALKNTVVRLKALLSWSEVASYEKGFVCFQLVSPPREAATLLVLD